MPTVTLTTDWGKRDYYLAAFKGRLISQCPDIRIVDISNEVDHFDILQASFILKNCYEKFPAGTIHYIGVGGNESRHKSDGYLLVECNKHYFIGFDNGVFSLALDNNKKQVYRTNINKSLPDHVIMDEIAGVISMIAGGASPESIFKDHGELISVLNSTPSFDHDNIRGSIVYIDSFQNIVSNIPAKLIEETGAGRSFSIVVRNHECKFKKVYTHYSEAESGEPICLFNEKGLLELALNGSNAAGLLGVKVLDNIRIEFHGALSLPNKEAVLPNNSKALTEN